MLKRSITTDNAIGLFTDGKTAFLVDGPWQLTDDRSRRHQVRRLRGPRLRGHGPGPAVRHRRRGVRRQQGREQDARAGVRHQLLVTRPTSRARSSRPTQAAPALTAALDQVKGDEPDRREDRSRPGRERPDHAEHPGDGGGLGPARQGRGGGDRRRRPGSRRSTAAAKAIQKRDHSSSLFGSLRDAAGPAAHRRRSETAHRLRHRDRGGRHGRQHPDAPGQQGAAVRGWHAPTAPAARWD